MDQFNKTKQHEHLFEQLSKWAEIKLNIQSGSVDSLESKAGVLLAGAGVAISIFANALLNSSKYNLNTVIIIGLAILFIGMILNTLSLWVKDFRSGIEIEKLYKKHTLTSKVQANVDLLNQMEKILKINERGLKAKGYLFNVAVVLCGVGIIVVLYGLCMQI